LLKQLVRNNRSYRRFDASVKITKRQIYQLINLARLCPSAANQQNLRFFYSINPDDNAIIFQHVAWAAYLKDWHGPKPAERPSAYILILGPKNISQNTLIDTGIAAQTILLGATEIGLGGCMLGSARKEELHEALNLPSDLEIILGIALGKPAEKVVLEKVTDPDNIQYWRDESGVHHVPKRALKDLIINDNISRKNKEKL